MCICFNYANAILNENSCIGAKPAFYRLFVSIFLSRRYVMLLKASSTKSMTVEQQADLENLRNLMFVRSEQSFVEDFDHTEIDCMIVDTIQLTLYVMNVVRK